ncbi:MAG: Lipopolysaccharide kinase (Kdo/WaaP) family [Planctomycetota bacterium]
MDRVRAYRAGPVSAPESTPDLDPLPGTAVQLLKDEPEARVEVRQTAQGPIVHKTYRNRGLRWWQTFGRRSRAAREFANLQAVAALGLPCTPPLHWAEHRRGKFVDHSTLVTGLLAPAESLKVVLRSLDGLVHAAERRALAAAAGDLLRRLHAGGILWSTPMPRNLLVLGSPAEAKLAVCDVPNAVRFAGSILGKPAARIDLFRAAFSPSRRRDWTPQERWRWTLAYAAGDREEAKRLWRDLSRRTTMGTDLRRSLSAVRNVYLGSDRKSANAT